MARGPRPPRGATGGIRHGGWIDRPSEVRWIIDGHNAIFAVREWEDLQITGRKREARRALEENLEAFGRAIGSQIVVVYDGNEMERNPDAVSSPHLRTEYSYPPEEADDRIRYLAMQALREGEKPVVVTSDRRTLSDSLPTGARSLEVGRFYRDVYPRWNRRPEKWEPSGMEDIERHFLGEPLSGGPETGDEGC
jgi:predicted RNA-binding protein with PIN domain